MVTAGISDLSVEVCHVLMISLAYPFEFKWEQISNYPLTFL